LISISLYIAFNNVSKNQSRLAQLLIAEPKSLIPNAIIFTGAILSLIQNILESQKIFTFVQFRNISAVSGYINLL
jgi:hypothetical protein